ncbi:MAG: serine/threonine-protein kinase [Myxococcota bacterium]
MGDTQPTSEPDALLGRVLDDHYRITARLGEGGMSVVYRAERDDGPPVAVKVLHEELGDDPDQRERFEREARALFALQHPNILEVHDFGIVEGNPYLVMELLEGSSLDVLLEEGPPDPATALDIARQFLAGLAFAHEQGVLHRDLKAENIFIQRAPDGRFIAKLLDFGLVKFVDDGRWGEARSLTTQGMIFGTPAYMSPEQTTGAPTDARTDVYSAGVILFELLTGIWPFMEEDRVSMFRAHFTKAPPTLAETHEDADFDPALEAVYQKALAKKPDDRFPDARAMLAALEAVPEPAARPKHNHVTGGMGTGHGILSKPLVWVALGAGALLILGVTGIAILAFLLG